MKRRLSSLLIPVAILIPTELSCSSGGPDAEPPSGPEPAPPEGGANGLTEAPTTPAETDMPASEAPTVPGVEEQLPDDIALDEPEPAPPDQPTRAATPGELTTPVPPVELQPLDCGPDGWAVENAGPPSNRVNYVILADGYDATTINTTLEEHVRYALLGISALGAIAILVIALSSAAR